MNFFLECCCTSLEEAKDARRKGASRIELCTDLDCGGLTPPPELISRVVGALDIPVNVLVRCRPGDFVYTDEEVEEMAGTVKMCAEIGAAGVVVGALDASGNVDVKAVSKMLSPLDSVGTRCLSRTFHRAFDRTADPFKALENIVPLGFDRILTSGHEPDAFAGKDCIAQLISTSSGRILIMPGCGVRPSNIDEIAAVTRAREFHASYKNFFAKKTA